MSDLNIKPEPAPAPVPVPVPAPEPVKKETFTFDRDKFKKLGQNLIDMAKDASKEAANAAATYTAHIDALEKEVRAGRLSRPAAREAALRYKRVLGLKLKAQAERVNWELVRQISDATDDVIEFAFLLISKALA